MTSEPESDDVTKNTITKDDADEKRGDRRQRQAPPASSKSFSSSGAPPMASAPPSMSAIALPAERRHPERPTRARGMTRTVRIRNSRTSPPRDTWPAMKHSGPNGDQEIHPRPVERRSIPGWKLASFPVRTGSTAAGRYGEVGPTRFWKKPVGTASGIPTRHHEQARSAAGAPCLILRQHLHAAVEPAQHPSIRANAVHDDDEGRRGFAAEFQRLVLVAVRESDEGLCARRRIRPSRTGRQGPRPPAPAPITVGMVGPEDAQNMVFAEPRRGVE